MNPVTPPGPGTELDDRTHRLLGGPGPAAPARPAVEDWAAVLRPAQQPGELGRLGPYRVLGVLGRGGMGVVFLAEDPALRRRIALKTLLPGAGREAATRFLREARGQAAVEHDHVVPVHQVGEDAGVPFLAMPLLQGKTLATELLAGPLPPAEAVRIGAEIADGLAAAHARQLVHRDIKPGNVWLEGDRRRVKILDFGLVRATGVRAGSQSEFQLPSVGVIAGGEPLTELGEAVGTPAYMSPEQALGDPVDHRTDLYSLGAVLFHAVTGRMPFPGTDSLAVMAAVADGTPPAPAAVNPAVPAGLDAVIRKLMAREPADRPATAAAVADELRTLSVTPRRRRRWPLAVAAVAVAVGLWFGLPYIDPRHRTGDPGARLAHLTIRSGGMVELDDGKVLRQGSGRPPRPPLRPVAVTVGPEEPAAWADLISTLARCESVRRLEFAGSRLTDADLGVLALGPAGTQLEALAVTGCPNVTDRGLEAVAKFAGLRRLRLGGPFTEPAVRELAAALPACRIEWPGGVVEPTQE